MFNLELHRHIPGPFDPSIQFLSIFDLIDHHGGDVGGSDGCYESSLLYFAVSAGNVRVVNELLARGIDPNLQGLFILSLFIVFII